MVRNKDSSLRKGMHSWGWKWAQGLRGAWYKCVGHLHSTWFFQVVPQAVLVYLSSVGEGLPHFLYQRGLLFCWLWYFHLQSLLCCHKSVVLSRTVLGNQLRVWKSWLSESQHAEAWMDALPGAVGAVHMDAASLIAMCYWGGCSDRWELYTWMPHLLLLCVTWVGVSQASPEEGDGYIQTSSGLQWWERGTPNRVCWFLTKDLRNRNEASERGTEGAIWDLIKVKQACKTTQNCRESGLLGLTVRNSKWKRGCHFACLSPYYRLENKANWVLPNLARYLVSNSEVGVCRGVFGAWCWKGWWAWNLARGLHTGLGGDIHGRSIHVLYLSFYLWLTCFQCF